MKKLGLIPEEFSILFLILGVFLVALIIKFIIVTFYVRTGNPMSGALIAFGVLVLFGLFLLVMDSRRKI